MAGEYQVRLDVFSGPLDLLLYLIRRDELDVQDIPITRVAEQYLAYVAMLERVDPNAAGEFLVMASTLIEIKSRALLPASPLEPGGEDDDPRAMLVRQLLEYKRFKDAARRLGSAAEERLARYARRPPQPSDALNGVELEEAEVWDLLAAFNRVMDSIGKGPSLHEVRYDDTPIALFAAEIVSTLEREGTQPFDTLFSAARPRWELVGLFLALLELMRQKRVRVEQARAFGAIYLFLLDESAAATAFGEEAAQREARGPSASARGAEAAEVRDGDAQ